MFVGSIIIVNNNKSLRKKKESAATLTHKNCYGKLSAIAVLR